MKIGIIVFSQTGHNHSVALELEEKLSEAGHTATVERVEVSGDARPGARDFQLTTAPDVTAYDAMVFGAPVQAFSLAVAMKSYLEQIASLENKKVACFVTKQLPFYWTGGRQAIGTMKRICESKGATICASEILIWSGSQRDQKIRELIEKLSGVF